jgi:glycosyltransferase involved in cell wall biosynthesis
MLNNSCGISIVIPAYNESARLGRTLDRVLSFVGRQEWDAEVVVVDDGSSDSTAEIISDYAQKYAIVRLVQNPGNRGKGYSVRNGVLNARGAIVLFTDADLSSPIEEAPKLIEALDAGADVAIGSRWVRSELQTQRQSVARQVMGRVFNMLLRILLRLDFKDTQCGFKAFRRSAARALFPLQKIEGWGFDPEILFLACRMGLKVSEVPVVWAHDEGTRINPVSDGSKMVLEMMRIRWFAVMGKYGDGGKVARPGVLAEGQRPRP